MNYVKSKLKKELWNKAHDVLISTYGEMPDIRILNRFYTEKMLFGEGDSIILWDLVAEIRRRAKEKCYTTSLGGTDGSCFAAHLLGMCENPLPLHYLCPKCKKTEFVSDKALPWDMPDKPCDCGSIMHAEGFDIPCETHIRMAHKPCPNVWLSPAFLEEAEKITREKLADLYQICELDNHNFATRKLSFLPFKEASSENDDFPGITIIPFNAYKYYASLGEKTDINFSEVNLKDPSIIKSFASGDVRGIPNFTSNFLDMSDALRLAAPNNYYDLLQFLGAMHGTNTWCNNGECLIRDGICTISNIPTHRDDVYMLLRDKLREAGYEDAGIAYNLAMKIRCGTYARFGICPENRTLLEYLDLPEWFISYAEKIDYMFPKAHNVESLRIALTFMWYKINYPEEFEMCAI